MKGQFDASRGAQVGAIALILAGVASCDAPTAVPTPTAPSETLSPSPTAPTTKSQVTQRNFACNTPNYFAEIRGKDSEIGITFGPNTGSLILQNAPVSYSTSADSSQIYVFQGETTTTATIYPNRDCLLRVVNSVTGETTVQESGRIAAIGQRPPNPPTPKPPEPTPSVENPEPDDLNLICRGTIQDRVDFSVYFTREWGFNRIEFRPRISGATLTGNLDYSGKNELGQDLWKGSVNAMADVVLVHLSIAAAQPGDQVSVRYDASWGRGVCE